MYLTKSSEFISMGARQVAVRQSINNLRGKKKKRKRENELKEKEKLRLDISKFHLR